MKTFKQYIKESGFQLEDPQVKKQAVINWLNWMKDVIEAPPYNFTWVFDLQKMDHESFTDWETVAYRKIECDNIVNHTTSDSPAINGDMNIFSVICKKQWSLSTNPPDIVRISGPELVFSPQQPYNFKTDLDKFTMFYVDEREFHHIDWGTFNANRSLKDAWDIYNYYQSVYGSKYVKVIKMLEMLKSNSKHGWAGWSDRMDIILSELKAKYMSDEATDDDHALNAMANL